MGAVHRALVLLKLMAKQGSLSVTEAARALDVNPSTAQRLLATLAADGFAQQGERKRYEPGPEFLRPGMVRPVPPLKTAVRPFLERLFENVHETVHLATLVGTEIHHVDGIEATSRALRFGLRTGVRLPAHTTSAGKATLAELPRDEVNARYGVALSGVRGREPDIDLDKIHKDLEQTRLQRIGVNFEESEAGVAAFAVSLGVINGERAAFSIAMPFARYAQGDVDRFAAHLLAAAQETREALGDA
ncbi:IclR family transcriptional regulator [Streptomyces sp. NBC_01320]|uniref:IclR family transcriptional regulator n=1 Tax=Streptomyces sp. NBC_01320 TaxID=2903824 RepID=UPI002E11CF17|nr:IclR family transcriptional regulator [Streptomyces sp. NBC_01320]